MARMEGNKPGLEKPKQCVFGMIRDWPVVEGETITRESTAPMVWGRDPLLIDDDTVLKTLTKGGPLHPRSLP